MCITFLHSNYNQYLLLFITSAKESKNNAKNHKKDKTTAG